MVSFNIGDRVKWRHSEPTANPEELHGKVTDIEVIYTVRWDDGTEETCDEIDIELEVKPVEFGDKE